MALLRRLRGVAHNSTVTDANPDPPQMLSTAEEKFRTFLVAQNYPKPICWLMPGDVVVDTNRHYWVRKREAEATRYAAQRYSVGLERNFGIKLQAICATEAETFASVFVHEDDLDAQHHLMGRGFKVLMSRRKVLHVHREESVQVEGALVAERPAQQWVGSVKLRLPKS
jgi:hypothetical protein